MNFYFLLFLLLFACKEEQAVKSMPISPKAVEKETSCNYIFKKEKVTLLQEQLQSKPYALKETALTQFLIDSLLPCWYGTTWDFNGTTEEPGKGSIACGYFVTTVLRDAGIQLNRIKLSQCASEEMIKKLSVKNSITRFSNQPMDLFLEKMKQKPKGIYIVGLDFHTGFLYHDGKEVYFIHASYAQPKIVRKEKVIESGVLAASKYKVVGKVNWQ
jgi:hypothetical protein